MMKDQMPAEDEIGALLEKVQPQPGATLRARVANATWNAPAAPSAQRRPAWGLGGNARRFAFAALAIIGVLIVFFTIPPFSGIAQRVAYFFERSDQDTLTLALTPQAPSQQFPLTLAEAETQAGFPVHQPAWLPAGFRFNGATYEADRQAVLLDYYSPIPGKFLRLTQSQTAENQINVSNIGATAEVQAVEIRRPSGESVSGEYVAGAWRLPAVLDHLQTDQPDMTATMQANWDPNAKIHMLRWEMDGVLYEIIHADQTLETLSAEMLVKIAESMK
jgi:hypothetical protein